MGIKKLSFIFFTAFLTAACGGCAPDDYPKLEDDAEYKLGYETGYSEGYDIGYEEGYTEYTDSILLVYSDNDYYTDGYLSALDFVLDSLPITERFTDEELEEFWEEYDTYDNYKITEKEEPLKWAGKTND